MRRTESQRKADQKYNQSIKGTPKQHARYRSSWKSRAKSFILKEATRTELKEFSSLIAERLKNLAGEEKKK